jgi:hypothetical protein
MVVQIATRLTDWYDLWLPRGMQPTQANPKRQASFNHLSQGTPLPVFRIKVVPAIRREPKR